MAKRKRRSFTPEFKAKVVLEALRGESLQAEVCRRHNLSEDQLSNRSFYHIGVSPQTPSLGVTVFDTCQKRWSFNPSV